MGAVERTAQKALLRIFVALVAAAMLASASLAHAQSATADVTSHSQLLEKEKELKQQALAGNGAASVKLSDYGNHYTMLACRNKSGGAELHGKVVDIFYVLEGSATLQTGGTLVNSSRPNEAKPDELTGTAVEGGVETPLHEGDVVHIPAGVPHRLMVPDGTDFCYFVVKVREE
jgi:mannose-6-phosphate isomerase-like protein (cupin superfamily)